MRKRSRGGPLRRQRAPLGFRGYSVSQLVPHTCPIALHGAGSVKSKYIPQKKKLGSTHLKQRLAVLVGVLVLDGDAELLEQAVDLFLAEVHDGVEHLVDGVQHVHAERALVVVVLLLRPLLGLGVEEVLTPQPAPGQYICEQTVESKRVE